MDLRKQHLICTYLLLCLGTTALWLSETNQIAPYPLVVGLCAVAAYFFTDRFRLMELPHIVSNLLAIVIMFTIFRELWVGSQNAMIALGHFLVYLQVVKFFRQKQASDFAMMYINSMLQICIGCIITPQLAFGITLFAYFCLALWTLLLFQLARPHLSEPITQTPRRMPTRSLLVTGVKLGLFSLPAAIVLFWVVPRSGTVKFSPGRNQDPATAALTTGFTKTVSLGEMAKVMENPDVVFRFRCYDRNGQEKEPSPMQLWRGGVMTNYLSDHWEPAPRYALRASYRRFEPVAPAQFDTRFEIELDWHDAALFPPEPLKWAACNEDLGTLLMHRMEGRLEFRGRPAGLEQEDTQFRYEAATFTDSADQQAFMTQQYLFLTQKDPLDLTVVRETAQRLTSDLQEDDVKGKINRILQYLNDPANFTYTLDLTRVDRSLDPIEDFLVNTKRGHCEYFASALALMLRAVGVSTRLVNGFKGWDYSETTGYYEVRQLHAHAWVEAYLPDEARWVTLDPSPVEGREAAVASVRSSWFSLSELANTASEVWAFYIVGFNDVSQQRFIESASMRLSNLREWLRSFLMEIASLGVQQPRQLAAPIGIFVVLVTLLALLLKNFRKVLGWLRRQTRSSTKGATATSLPVYDEWLRLLDQIGYVRDSHQTPKEFAQQVQQQFNGSSSFPADFPLTMAELYYRVRFGGTPITVEESQSYRAALEQFRTHVRS